ncbi:MAG: YjdF family protein [Provencibacterium sp.]|jgi:hypothetical protein|nr:YjdF family protein [Provencibacterium sp.]
MNQLSGRLTVFFEEPFWVGVFERAEGGKLFACKVTFGAQPGDNEVYAFILCHYDQLHFSPPVKAPERRMKENPKRIRRQARRLLQAAGSGTKSQQALQRQREEAAVLRKSTSRQRRKAEKQRQFEERQQKRREKHRGR